MTSRELSTFTCKQLSDLARDRGMSGISSLRKNELISAILVDHRKRQRSHTSKRNPDNSDGSDRTRSNRTATLNQRKPARKRIVSEQHPSRQLIHAHGDADAVSVAVTNPYWLQIDWTVTSQTMARAEAALSDEWPRARLVLRLFEVAQSQTVGRTRSYIRDTEICGDAENWFLQIDHPGRRYSIQLGLVTPGGRYFQLACSKTVQTPNIGAGGDLRRTSSTASQNRHVPGKILTPDFTNSNDAGAQNCSSDFPFELDAQLIISGIAKPGSKISALDEAVDVNEDGTFSVAYRLPNGRQVIPFVAISRESGAHHTKVIALERNTKTLEVAQAGEM